VARTNTRRQHKQRQEFRAECESTDAECWLCVGARGPIDYAAAFNDWANELRFQEDHFWPVSTHPHLQDDPDNKRPSHAICNRERGNAAPLPDLGIPSRAWT